MKRFTTSLILLVLGVRVFAQSATGVPYIGLKVAANYSMNSFSNPSLADYSSNGKWGFAGGLFYNIPISGKFSIQPELLYSQMGSKLESTVDAGNNATLELDYASIPFLVKFSPIDPLAIFAGPQFDLMVTGNLNYDSKPHTDTRSSLNAAIPAVTLGAEYWFSKNFGVYARYMLGLGNLNEQDPGMEFNGQIITSDLKNSALQFGVTIRFPEEESSSSPEEPAAVHVQDTDGDGVIDKHDKCPNTPGSADNLGCPEMIVLYAHNDAAPDAADKANLDKVASFLKANPELKIIIEGHSSAPGDEKYNQKLSEDRAIASMDYLVSQGIDKKRMKAVGLGEKNPVGDNNTEEGKAANRRVVIRIDK
ncbi:MAG: OmpA family protein [Chitinophagaceae bacterium]|nr:OmpA family protein [Chitinophagaceae bacterium]